MSLATESCVVNRAPLLYGGWIQLELSVSQPPHNLREAGKS